MVQIDRWGFLENGGNRWVGGLVCMLFLYLDMFITPFSRYVDVLSYTQPTSHS